jgi:hypothetical protein
MILTNITTNMQIRHNHLIEDIFIFIHLLVFNSIKKYLFIIKQIDIKLL